MPVLAPWQWLLGAFCAALVGVAKTGVPGTGILAVPLMVFAVGDARAQAGWLLPLLCVADLFAIVIYRRHAQARRLFALAPWVGAGMVAGAFALGLPEPALRRIVGGIVLLMVATHLGRRRRPRLRGDSTGFARRVPSREGMGTPLRVPISMTGA